MWLLMLSTVHNGSRWLVMVMKGDSWILGSVVWKNWLSFMDYNGIYNYMCIYIYNDIYIIIYIYIFITNN
jgi:hypothetical protein